MKVGSIVRLSQRGKKSIESSMARESRRLARELNLGVVIEVMEHVKTKNVICKIAWNGEQRVRTFTSPMIEVVA